MNNILVCTKETINTTELNTNISSEVEHYSSLIDTYGASAVILSVFILVLFIVLYYIIRSNQKTNAQLMEQQKLLFKKLIEEKETVTEVSIKPKKEKNIIEMFMNINDNIKEILKKISEELDASRVSVYVFHNGMYSSHGLPFFKTSCISEVIKKNSGIIKEVKSHTNLPLEMFDSSISRLYKEGKITILNTEANESSDPVIVGMMRSNNVKSGVGIAIYDSDSNIVGVLIAEFNEQKESLKDAENLLISKAPYLAPILQCSGIYDVTK